MFRRMSVQDKMFTVFVYLLLGIVMFIVLYPLYVIVIASISDPYAVMRGEVLFYPKDISFVGYKRMLDFSAVWRGYLNTIIYTVAGTLLNVILTMMTGYALSRDFLGKRVVNFLFIFTMFFGGGLIPTFLLLKSYGLYNNPLIFIFVGAIGVWNVMVARTFMRTSLPNELYEAAVIDGCTHLTYFGKIAIPLSKALMGVLVVYYAVGHWNDFMTGVIYINKMEWQPLQVILRDILASLQMTSESMDLMLQGIQDNSEALRVAESVKYCAIVISTGPMLILYTCMQKYFEKGVMIGSLKG